MSSFTIAFSMDGIMRLVSRSKTKAYPQGLAYLIVKAMMKKYCPNDTMSRVEQRQKLNQVSMKKGSDPTILFEKLAAIEDQYGDMEGGVSKMDLIAIVLDAATDEYQSALTAEQSARGADLTLLDLELVMNKYYQQMVRKRGVKRTEDHEVLLAGFSGACFSCGKKGH